MSDDTRKSELDRHGNEHEEKPNRTLLSTNSSVVRDFLYLDQPKILSYLSQINGGLQLLVEQVQRQFNVSDKSDPEITDTVVATVSGEATGKIPLLADGTLTGEREHSNQVKTGGDRTLTGRVGQKATQTTIHHEAFEIVLAKLGEKLMVVEGEIALIDYDRLAYDLENYDKRLAAFNRVSGQKLAPTPNLDKQAELLRFSSAGRVSCIIRGAGKVHTAFLQKKYLTDDIQAITDSYGTNPSGNYILVGLKADQAQRDIDVNALDFNHISADATGIARANLNTILASNNVNIGWKYISADGNIHPIALFKVL